MTIITPLLLASLVAGPSVEATVPSAAPPSDTDAPQAGPQPPPPTSATRPEQDRELSTGRPDAGPYVSPFSSEPMSLGDAITEAYNNNLSLQSVAFDIEISEARTLSALGAYDLTLTAGLDGSVSETPQRGSSFTIVQGQRGFGADLGVERKLETGGRVALVLGFDRTATDQTANFLDPSSGTATLITRAVVPRLELSHPLLRGMGLKVNRADIDRGKLATSQAEAAKHGAARSTMRDVVIAYWDVLFAQRNLENRRLSLDIVNEQRLHTTRRVEAGTAAEDDLTAVEQSAAARETDLRRAEHQLLAASVGLRRLVGNPITGTDALGIDATTDPIVKPRRIIVAEEIDRTLETYPQLRQMRLAVQTGKIDVMVAKNQRLPQLDASMSFAPQGRSVDSLENAMFMTEAQDGSWGEAFGNMFNEDVGSDGLLADWTLSGGVTLRWDVQNRTAKGNYQTATLQMRKLQVDIRDLEQQLRTNVVIAASSLRTASEAIDSATLSVELAERNLATEQVRFDAGVVTNFDVLRRVDELDQSRAAELDAEIGYLKALVELQTLNGEILPAYGLTPT